MESQKSVFFGYTIPICIAQARVSGNFFLPKYYSHLVILTLKRIPSVFMYVMNIQNDVIGLVLRQNCKSKQVTDFIA
jgi:hypothetical protein